MFNLIVNFKWIYYNKQRVIKYMLCFDGIKQKIRSVYSFIFIKTMRHIHILNPSLRSGYTNSTHIYHIL